ncbi:MAG TPA: substrate-binding domain-containing protein [Gemmataceae bacterium]|jgi:ribose transport system substrate-binding protein
MKRILFVAALTGVLGSGCLHSEAPASRDARPVIGLSVLTLTNPFFSDIAENMKAEASKHGYDVIVVSGEFDAARQQNQVKDFIVRKAAAIVLCPCDSRAIGAAIQEANDAGIPVFTCDIACLAPGAEVVTHVATDNYAGGKQAAVALLEALGDAGGKVAILDFKAVESCQLRVKGFKEVIESHNRAEAGGKVTIVAELPGGGVKDQGYKAAQDLLEAHPDLAGIFAINDPSALGAYAALEKADKDDQVKLVGFDGQPEGKQAIKEGHIYADPVQYPERIGRETARVVARYFEGEQVPPEILIPTGLYGKADADKDPELK